MRRVPKLMNRVVKRLVSDLSLTRASIATVVLNGDGPVWDTIFKQVTLLDPAQLGVIAACGLPHDGTAEDQTALYQVHCGSYLGKYLSGLQLLHVLATTAIIAHLNDMLNPSFHLN